MEVVKKIVDPHIFEKFERFQMMKTNMSFRECPSCGEACQGGSLANPSIVCIKCNNNFCYVHSNAHANKSCQEYSSSLSKRVRKEMKAADKLIKRTTKACPQCSAPIEKNGGLIKFNLKTITHFHPLTTYQVAII